MKIADWATVTSSGQTAAAMKVIGVKIKPMATANCTMQTETSMMDNG